jgi:hypothetical protein
MNIRLHIEQLVVEGFGTQRADGPTVKAAVQAELTRLLRANGLDHKLQQGGAVPHVRAAPMPPVRNPSPHRLGNQIARSVYGGIGRAK